MNESEWKASIASSPAADLSRKMPRSEWKAQMVPDAGERRLYRRFPLQISVVVLSRESTQTMAGMTHDVSARGVYFYIPHEIETPSIEFILTFPPEITCGRAIRIQCQARVVRREPSTLYGVGMGAFIEDYVFLPQT